MLAVVELPVTHERNLLPTTLLPTTAQRCSSLATQSGSISSILSELERTTLSNSAVFKIEKCKAVASSGTSDIKYMPASNFKPIVGTTMVLTTFPEPSTNRLPTRPVPGTLGKRTRL